MFDPNAGNIEIELDDENLTLVPTLNAATNISTRLEGLINANNQVLGMNLNAMVTIIRFGASLDDKAAKSLPEKVYRAGLSKLQVPLLNFIGNLSRGGRPRDDEDDKADEGNAPS